MIVDESFAVTEQAFHLTLVHRVGDLTLRVRVYRDAYERQSQSVVEVLGPALAWT